MINDLQTAILTRSERFVTTSDRQVELVERRRLFGRVPLFTARSTDLTGDGGAFNEMTVTC